MKITLYRVAKESQIVDALIKAAENGKEVLAVIELRARFDEESNIVYSKRLEEAGVNVIYGLDEYKVHSKLLLITRKTPDGLQFITHFGTGNYNENTARLYTDLSILTANHEIGMDAVNVFSSLLLGNPVADCKRLLAAPNTLKPAVLENIEQEIAQAQAGGQGRVLCKINSLTDKEIMDALVRASCAGVQVQLIVRGICCLRPGIPRRTENITVRSIVGRFLEHSRVFIFGNGQRRRVYISSADFMTRNTQRRVEIAGPVLDPAIADRIEQMMQTLLEDTAKARLMQPDGSYIRMKPQQGQPPLDSQLYLYAQAYTRPETSALRSSQAHGQTGRDLAT